ncbi:MAG: putative ABC transporter permease [Oscillospiraceae bacterium]|nr:putative ABC transporter permease [Oscillospiraceae bacterium]
MTVRTLHQAQPGRERINWDTLFWLFVFGSVMGYIAEMLFCFYQCGYFENRSSMLFSPFNIIYGFGALALYICLYKIQDNVLWVFLFGVISGTVVEFLASWAQEMVFGSVSWEYSEQAIHFSGRISLRYSIYWGLLAVLWVKVLQPLLLKLIAAIPERVRKPLMIGLILFLVLDIAIAILAVARWGMRLDGIPATNSILMWVDRLFPDALMERAYANMTYVR